MIVTYSLQAPGMSAAVPSARKRMLIQEAQMRIAICTLIAMAVSMNVSPALSQNCRAISDPKERLTCFDKQSATPKAKTSKEDPVRNAVLAYLKETLFDYDSMKDLEIGSPMKATTRRTDLSPAGITGYAVKVSYNAKNRMGGYVGKQRQVAFVTGGRVLFMTEEYLLDFSWGPVQLD